MKVYITKYALTNGIEYVEGELFAEGRAVKYGAGWFQSAHGEGKDWHRTIEGAQERADKMRIKKIASMRAKIAKLEKMTF